MFHPNGLISRIRSENEFTLVPQPYYRIIKKSNYNSEDEESSIGIDSSEQFLKNLLTEKGVAIPEVNFKCYWESLPVERSIAIRESFFDIERVYWEEAGVELGYKPFELLSILNIDFSSLIMFGPSVVKKIGMEYFLNLTASYAGISSNELKNRLGIHLEEIKDEFEKRQNFTQIALPFNVESLSVIKNFFRKKAEEAGLGAELEMSFLNEFKTKTTISLKIGSYIYYFVNPGKKFHDLSGPLPQINLYFLKTCYRYAYFELLPSLPANPYDVVDLLVSAGEVSHNWMGYLWKISKGQELPSCKKEMETIRAFNARKDVPAEEEIGMSKELAFQKADFATEFWHILRAHNDFHPLTEISLLWNAENTLNTYPHLEEFSLLLAEINKLFPKNFAPTNLVEKMLLAWNQGVPFRAVNSLIKLHQYLNEDRISGHLVLSSSQGCHYFYLLPCKDLWKNLFTELTLIDPLVQKMIEPLLREIFSSSLNKAAVNLSSETIESFLTSNSKVLWQLGFYLFCANSNPTASDTALRKAFLLWSLDLEERLVLLEGLQSKTKIDFLAIDIDREKEIDENSWRHFLAKSKNVGLKQMALKIWEGKTSGGISDSEAEFGTALIESLCTSLPLEAIKVLERLCETDQLSYSQAWQYVADICKAIEMAPDDYVKISSLITMLIKKEGKEELPKIFQKEAAFIKVINGLTEIRKSFFASTRLAALFFNPRDFQTLARGSSEKKIRSKRKGKKAPLKKASTPSPVKIPIEKKAAPEKLMADAAGKKEQAKFNLSICIEELEKALKAADAEIGDRSKADAELRLKFKSLLEVVKGTLLDNDQKGLSECAVIVNKLLKNYLRFNEKGAINTEIKNLVSSTLEKLLKAAAAEGLSLEGLKLIQSIHNSFLPLPNSTSFLEVIQTLMLIELKKENCSEAISILELILKSILKNSEMKLSLFKKVYPFLSSDKMLDCLTDLFKNNEKLGKDKGFLLEVLEDLRKNKQFNGLARFYREIPSDPSFNNFWAETIKGIEESGDVETLKFMVLQLEYKNLSKKALSLILESIPKTELDPKDSDLSLEIFLMANGLIETNPEMLFKIVANLDRIDQLKLSHNALGCIIYFIERNRAAIQEENQKISLQALACLLEHKSLTLSGVCLIIPYFHAWKIASERYEELLGHLIAKWEDLDKPLIAMGINCLLSARPFSITQECFSKECQLVKLLYESNSSVLAPCLKLVHALLSDKTFGIQKGNQKTLGPLYIKILEKVLKGGDFKKLVIEIDDALRDQFLQKSPLALYYWILIMDSTKGRPILFAMARFMQMLAEQLKAGNIDAHFLKAVGQRKKEFKKVCRKLATSLTSPEAIKVLFYVLSHPKVQAQLADEEFLDIKKELIISGLKSVELERDIAKIQFFLELFCNNIEIFNDDINIELAGAFVSNRLMRIATDPAEPSFFQEARNYFIRFLEARLSRSNTKNQTEYFLYKICTGSIDFLIEYTKMADFHRGIFLSGTQFLNELIQLYFRKTSPGTDGRASLLLSCLAFNIKRDYLFDVDSNFRLLSKEFGDIIFLNASLNHGGLRDFILYQLMRLVYPDYINKKMEREWDNIKDISLLAIAIIDWLIKLKNGDGLMIAIDYMSDCQKDPKCVNNDFLISHYHSLIQIIKGSINDNIDLVDSLFNSLNEGGYLKNNEIILAMMDLLDVQFKELSNDKGALSHFYYLALSKGEEIRAKLVKQADITTKMDLLLRNYLECPSPNHSLFFDCLEIFCQKSHYIFQHLEAFPEISDGHSLNPVSIANNLDRFLSLTLPKSFEAHQCQLDEIKQKYVMEFFNYHLLSFSTFEASSLFNGIRTLESTQEALKLKKITLAVARDDLETFESFIDEKGLFSLDLGNGVINSVETLRIGNFSCLQIACFHSAKRLVGYLTKNFPKTMEVSESPLTAACSIDSFELISLLIERGVTKVISKEELATCIYQICLSNRKLGEDSSIELLKLLLEDIGKEALIAYCNTPLEKGASTVIQYCIEHNRVAVLDFLLESGVSSDLQDELGNTLMHRICQANKANFPMGDKSELIHVLLKYHPDLKLKNKAGLTIFATACLKGTAEILEHLSLTQEHFEPQEGVINPFIAAANLGDFDFFQKLVQFAKQTLQIDEKTFLKCLNSTNKSGLNPLLLIAEKNHTEFMNYLLNLNADPFVRSKQGLTALDIAVKNGSLHLVELMIRELTNHSKHPDDKAITHPPLSILTPLHHVFVKFTESSEDILKALLKYGVSLKAVDSQGRTALHYASNLRIVIRGKSKEKEKEAELNKMSCRMLKMLLKQMKKRNRMRLIDAKDNEGKTALQEAKENGDLDKVKILLQYGAADTVEKEKERKKKVACNKSL